MLCFLLKDRTSYNYRKTRMLDAVPVVNRLLDTFGRVTVGDEGAGRARRLALLHPRRLGQRLVVGVHPVDNDPPLALRVDSPEIGFTFTSSCIVWPDYKKVLQGAI